MYFYNKITVPHPLQFLVHLWVHHHDVSLNS